MAKDITKFTEAVIAAMKKVPEDVMWRWVDNPAGLEEALLKALTPPVNPDEELMPANVADPRD